MRYMKSDLTLILGCVLLLAGCSASSKKADDAGADGRGGTVAGGVTVSVLIPAGMEAELDLTALGLDVREHLIPGRYRFAPR